MTWRQRRSGLIVPENRVWSPARKHLNLIPGIVAAGGGAGGGGGGSDPYFSFVKALLHFDTDYTDVIGHTFANAATSINSSIKKFGAGSVEAIGGSRRVGLADADFAITGDFAAECWHRPEGVMTRQVMSLTDFPTAFFWIRTNGSNVCSAQCGGSTIAGATLSDGVWYHLAIARASGTFRFFIDGAEQGNASVAGNFTGTPLLRIGYDDTGPATFEGYVDDFRYTVGSARGYTTSFTPPAAPFPDA